ncbi:hypothetical protein FA13DRAFT_1729486 [Coprinellus micaceus]|uniref:F-box domain-containing protein n=1 Tax=Coprinellus micaceus TaxID=71717 RepID=A0A4Y7TIL6_COPMI|nr:hypothetical protein FA13DRAFT_1729486 [Coprinellus micaceus]
MANQPTSGAFSVRSLPPEIWSFIFDVACLDDGFTARSLSLVSRDLHALSEGHRYYTIKISSSSQMVALERQLSESGVIAARGLKTRFVSVTFPVHSAGQEALSIEIADIERDEKENEWKPAITTSVEDLNYDSKHSVVKFHYLVYGAMRRLLEACSNTLEVLSIYQNPAFLIQFDVLVPPLPRLQHLSIGLSPRGSWATMGDPHPMHYPSLQVLRLMGWPLPGGWWKRITQSIPDSSDVKIISVLRLYRSLGYCDKKKGYHTWKFVKENFDEAALPGLLEKWWVEDVNGGNGIPGKEELDERHGNGYQYEADDDL